MSGREYPTEFLRILSHLERQVNALVWGPAMIGFILVTGFYFTLRTGFFQITHLRLWIRCTLLAIFRERTVRDKSDASSISQFQALTTALAGTIGTGNIVGVATAIVSGGPGAVFWMWFSALFGMMTKFAENVLGNHYRYRSPSGNWSGGPMIYIERGLGCKWLAVMFAFFCLMASFGIGCMTQSNSIAGALSSTFGVSPAAAGILVALFGGLVILGGLKRIASVAERLVPFMALSYIFGGLVLIFLNRSMVPSVLRTIFQEALRWPSIGGGAAGILASHAVRYGVARGVFSNEAGLGCSVMVNSASNVKEPVRQGMWGIFEVFLDTLVVCTITALAILTTNAQHSGLEGAALSVLAFSSVFGSFGGVFIALSITCFAFSTLLGWSYYGELSLRYLFGEKPIPIYRLCFVLLAGIGCVAKLELVWNLSDTFNGLMALPNLIGILALSGEVSALTKSYLKKEALLASCK